MLALGGFSLLQTALGNETSLRPESSMRLELPSSPTCAPGDSPSAALMSSASTTHAELARIEPDAPTEENHGGPSWTTVAGIGAVVVAAAAGGRLALNWTKDPAPTDATPARDPNIPPTERSVVVDPKLMSSIAKAIQYPDISLEKDDGSGRLPVVKTLAASNDKLNEILSDNVSNPFTPGQRGAWEQVEKQFRAEMGSLSRLKGHSPELMIPHYSNLTNIANKFIDQTSSFPNNARKRILARDLQSHIKDTLEISAAIFELSFSKSTMSVEAEGYNFAKKIKGKLAQRALDPSSRLSLNRSIRSDIEQEIPAAAVRLEIESALSKINRQAGVRIFQFTPTTGPVKVTLETGSKGALRRAVEAAMDICQFQGIIIADDFIFHGDKNSEKKIINQAERAKIQPVGTNLTLNPKNISSQLKALEAQANEQLNAINILFFKRDDSKMSDKERHARLTSSVAFLRRISVQFSEMSSFIESIPVKGKDRRAHAQVCADLQSRRAALDRLAQQIRAYTEAFADDVRRQDPGPSVASTSSAAETSTPPMSKKARKKAAAHRQGAEETANAAAKEAEATAVKETAAGAPQERPAPADGDAKSEVQGARATPREEPVSPPAAEQAKDKQADSTQRAKRVEAVSAMPALSKAEPIDRKQFREAAVRKDWFVQTCKLLKTLDSPPVEGTEHVPAQQLGALYLESTTRLNSARGLFDNYMLEGLSDNRKEGVLEELFARMDAANALAKMVEGLDRHKAPFHVNRNECLTHLKECIARAAALEDLLQRDTPLNIPIQDNIAAAINTKDRPAFVPDQGLEIVPTSQPHTSEVDLKRGVTTVPDRGPETAPAEAGPKRGGPMILLKYVYPRSDGKRWLSANGIDAEGLNKAWTSAQPDFFSVHVHPKPGRFTNPQDIDLNTFTEDDIDFSSGKLGVFERALGSSAEIGRGLHRGRSLTNSFVFQLILDNRSKLKAP